MERSNNNVIISSSGLGAAWLPQVPLRRGHDRLIARAGWIGWTP